MSIFSRSLISFLLFPLIVQSQELTSKVSGFVYGTVFQHDEWHEDKYVGAINLDAEYKHLRASVQAGTESDNTLRRATLEASYPYASKNTLYAVVGRFPRLDSFFNNATDNPGTSGTAILPFAGYNYRFQKGTFVTMDGVEVKTTSVLPNSNMLTVRASRGAMYVDNPKEMNEYFFTTYQSGIIFDEPNASYDYGVHLEGEHYHVFYSFNHYEMDTKAIKNDPMTIYLASKFSNLNYDVQKIGTKYHDSIFWVQSEIFRGKTRLYGIKGNETFWQDTHEGYGMVGVYLNDHYQAYAGRSISRSKLAGSEKSANDTFIGVTRETGKYAVSIEHHHGEGSAWSKFNSGMSSWHTWVMSGTYRF